ncbi:MAG: Dna2/Cas4 domain-containing protein [Clostridia bacterium]|nr:Dna2/Cas4 domain-containing protein [Clostridia bacterium]
MKCFDDSVDLRSIQQYLYCPHRFGLMENDCSWAENVFVSRGNLAHERGYRRQNNIFPRNDTRAFDSCFQ